jgi:2-polyprenyl-3-methyl-5-hydroxy-6-metoxy-1,4-benzoquinol methylase
MSVEFHWESKDLHFLVESCARDTSTPYIPKYMPKEGLILEAGCGMGRYVEFLSRRGFNVLGIELSQDTVDMVSALVPHLDITQARLCPFRLDAPYLAISTSEARLP